MIRNLCFSVRVSSIYLTLLSGTAFRERDVNFHMQIFSKLYYFHPCLAYMLGIVPKKNADLQYTYSKSLHDYRESTHIV